MYFTSLILLLSTQAAAFGLYKPAFSPRSEILAKTHAKDLDSLPHRIAHVIQQLLPIDVLSMTHVSENDQTTQELERTLRKVIVQGGLVKTLSAELFTHKFRPGVNVVPVLDPFIRSLAKIDNEAFSALQHMDLNVELSDKQISDLSDRMTWHIVDVMSVLHAIASRTKQGFLPYGAAIYELDESLHRLALRLKHISPKVVSAVQDKLRVGGFFTGHFYAVGIDDATKVLAPAIIS